MAEILAHIKILPVKHPHLYQKLTQKATELHLLGMSYLKIGKILGIDPKTVKKATEDVMSEEVPNSTEFGQSQ
ncbi:MAG TPA: hypothetical protein DCY56_04330 [Candidatus Omnitrophica bacterium]|nr:hypothetical protein [Candidatus Omnitrophota bacterium]